jgi:hypothetical protein
VSAVIAINVGDFSKFLNFNLTVRRKLIILSYLIENKGNAIILYLHDIMIYLSITNKMQGYTIFFIGVEALHVSSRFPSIIRSSNCTHSIWYTSSLFAATTSGSSKQA